MSQFLRRSVDLQYDDDDVMAEITPQDATAAADDGSNGCARDDSVAVDNYIVFRFESARLESYFGGCGDGGCLWSSSNTDPRRMAKAGFYFTGKADGARCFECRLTLRGWTHNADPRSDHTRFSERCRFVRRIPCGNVPLDALNASEPRPPNLGMYGLIYYPNAVTDLCVF